MEEDLQENCNLQFSFRMRARLVAKFGDEKHKKDCAGSGHFLSLSVDKGLAKMKELTQHFDRRIAWSKAQDAQKMKEFHEKWQQLCTSAVTLRNLKRSVFGFLFFAKAILNDNVHGLHFVDFLFSNSATIESMFQFSPEQIETHLNSSQRAFWQPI